MTTKISSPWKENIVDSAIAVGSFLKISIVYVGALGVGWYYSPVILGFLNNLGKGG